MNNLSIDNIKNQISKRLKFLRKRMGLTQEQFSKITGITKIKIARLETGKIMPDIITLIIFSEFFGVSVNYLVGLEDYSDYLWELCDSVSLSPIEYIQKVLNYPNNHEDALEIFMKKHAPSNLKMDMLSRIMKLDIDNQLSTDSINCLIKFLESLSTR